MLCVPNAILREEAEALRGQRDALAAMLPVGSNVDAHVGGTCSVCLCAHATRCFIPCGHVALCADCDVTLQLRGATVRCTVCRTPSEQLVRVFYP